MGFNGRALNLLRKYGKRRPTEQLSEKCPELHNTNHFHADYLGYYISPGCTGMGIMLEDIGKELDPKKYPVMSKLFRGGVRELFEYARELGYNSDPVGYYSKCELCFCIRKYLINKDREAHPDLTPRSFYSQNY